MNSTFLLNALLQHNYLPLQKKDKAEIPPFLSTVCFTPQIASSLLGVTKRSPGDGWDVVNYQATRFTGVGRILSIPHPLAYAFLCSCIYNNWAQLSYSARSKNSLVRPRQHPDGRTIIMDYEKSHKSAQSLGFGKRFQVKTDIANCFPSIYSHAITWAAVGFGHAKANKSGNWFNDLDKKIRWAKRNETQGVSIGPATSNIVTELILARVDEQLDKLGFQFIRYIDDYTAYCESEDKAQDFILCLSQQLADYKLSLNIKKTHILPLPVADADEWVSELALALPAGEIDKYVAVNYLNKATAMAAETPDGSVLKYAIKTLLSRKLKFGVVDEILPQVLSLAYHRPILIPLLDTLLQKSGASVGIKIGGNLHYGWVSFKYGDQLQQLATVNARFRRSDGLCWALFYMIRHKIVIDDVLASAVIATKDCLPILLMYLCGDAKHQSSVVDFAKQHVAAAADLYELDQNWLLLYELFRENKIADPYPNEGAFDFLKKQGITFSVAPAPAQPVAGTSGNAATQAAAATVP